MLCNATHRGLTLAIPKGIRYRRRGPGQLCRVRIGGKMKMQMQRSELADATLFAVVVEDLIAMP
jgi:hypothetical protein